MVLRVHVPGRDGRRGGGAAFNQLLVVMDGIDNPPFMRRVMTNRTNTLLDASFIVPSPDQGQVAAGCRRRARARSRSTSSAPRTSRSTGSIPRRSAPVGWDGTWFRHPDEARPARHHRPLHQQGLARPRARHAEASRRDRARDERLLAGDDRTGHVDGANDRAPLRSRALQLEDLVESITTLESAPRSASSTSIARAGRLRFTRRGTRSRGTLS